MDALATLIDQPESREAGGLLLQLAEGIGALEGILGGEIGKEASLDRVAVENGSEALHIEAVVQLDRLGSGVEGRVVLTCDGRIVKAGFEEVEKA